jgi:hypothetical protein
MKAAKAYLAVLGTTGLLTATVVVLLVVGSGVAAFEGPPDAGGTTSPLERIVVDEDAEAAADGARARRAAGLEAHRAAPRPPAGRQRSGSGQGVVRLGLRGAPKGLVPPPVPDPVGGVAEGATGVVGGTLDGVAPGGAPPVTEVGSGVGRAIGGAGSGPRGLLR